MSEHILLPQFNTKEENKQMKMEIATEFILRELEDIRVTQTALKQRIKERAERALIYGDQYDIDEMIEDLNRSNELLKEIDLFEKELKSQEVWS